MMRSLFVSLIVAGVVGVFGFTDSAPAAQQAPEPKLTASEIVAKNVAARGGLEAWRKIQTMAWAGHMESPNSPMPDMRFVLQQERPNKTRFEVTTMNKKTVRVFDGAHGWKVRTGHDGRPELQPFTPEELRFAHAAQAVDGLLMDYERKGNMVNLEGSEEIDGHKTYRLNIRLASGEPQKVWIDAKTFLDIRYDRMSYDASGKPGFVSVYSRNYRTVEGLQIPSALEIGVGSGKPTDRMVIEKVALNPPFDARTFAKPTLARGRDLAARGMRPTPEMK
jgi:hypothetical protein